MFDNGYFSEFGTFSITDWLGHAPKRAAGQEFRAAGRDVRRTSRRRRFTSPRARSRPRSRHSRCRAGSSRRSRTSTVCCRRSPTRSFKGGTEWRVGRLAVSDFHDHDGRRARAGAGRAARTALAPERRRVAIRPRADNSASRCSAQRAAGAKRRSNQGDVGYIPQGFGHSIENIGGEKARILIVFNSGHYQTIDLSQWLAGNPANILATNFAQDASVFEKFPRRDVFLTK